MPDIGEMKYGTSKSGVDAYIDAIQAEVLDEAARELLEGLDSIDTACDKHWEGQAKERFKENLRTDAEHVRTQYGNLLLILRDEIHSANAAMVNKDKSMFD